MRLKLLLYHGYMVDERNCLNQLQFGRQKTRLNSVDFAVAAAEREDIDEATARHVVVAGVRRSTTLISGARALVNVVCKQTFIYMY